MSNPSGSDAAAVSDSEKSALRAAENEMAGVPGVTPLHAAAAFGHVDHAKKLIAEGMDLDAADSKGHTPLFYAAKYNRIDVVRLLLEAGASPD